MAALLRSRVLLRPNLLLHRRCMSVQPGITHTATHARKKTTIQSLHALKSSGTPIAMVTTYDYPTALAVSSPSANVDIALVGDSLAQVCLGYPSTTQLTLDEMIHHARAVARGCSNAHPLLIADMPFGSFHVSPEDTLANAVRLVREGHVEGVKLEGGREVADVVRRLTQVGIPVMAHVGLCPQRHVAMSGYKVQGRDVDGARRVLQDAVALEEAGAFATVVEAVPQELGRVISEKLKMPTIGIGAGKWTDGQVLVWDDIMGTWPGHKAKFVRRFADVKAEREKGLRAYTEAVRARTFPDEESESYKMDQMQKELLDKFMESTNTSTTID